MRKCNFAVTTVAILLYWAAASVATPAQHEGHGELKPPAQENQRQPETQRNCRQMEISITTSNHLVASAYLQNIATLTRLLRDQVQQCNSVNGDFARDVVAEIWRSFDQLDSYRREQTGMTQGGMRLGAMRDHSSMAATAPSEYLALREIGAERGALTPPSPAVQGDQTTNTAPRMEACLTRLSARLVELERETGAANPNPKWVLEHANAILMLLEEISAARPFS
jgi:hypothetical protein